MDFDRAESELESLDPADWQAMRSQAHRMLDDIIDYVENIRDRPVWQPVPERVRDRFGEGLPAGSLGLASVHDAFLRDILPYATGNTHPRFMGWVHGGGNIAGMLAEMLAAGLNANLGGRDHAPIDVELQIVRWMRQLFTFPDTATGLFVTGSSMANLIGILVARTQALGVDCRRAGVSGHNLVAYISAAAHGCVAQAMDLTGLGIDSLRIVPTNAAFQMDLDVLQEAIDRDRQSGLRPFLVVGTAGTVDVGAIDDLAALAHITRRENLWFHVDGAFGALGMLAADIAPKLSGIETADSIALDFHKWLQVPYDAGFILVRDGILHRATFASPAAYLRRETKGLAGGAFWPCDYGPDLSRGFRALKTWFTLKSYGTAALGRMISQTCQLARYLEIKIITSREFELLAPVNLNIVCFRFRADNPDEINAKIVVELQARGIAAPSTTIVNGQLAIRAAIVNHRTQVRDIDALLTAAAAIGADIVMSEAA
jgi:glutamate/tyrosine decarboxylase-like PLP-dependent enzyme